MYKKSWQWVYSECTGFSGWVCLVEVGGGAEIRAEIL